jgi:hypothetical protein
MWLRLWRRPKAEKLLAIHALALCLLSVIALRLIGFGRWKRILWLSSGGGELGARSPPRDDIKMAKTAYSVVDMVARNIPWELVTCLPRSLTLWWILRRYGIESELRMGVRRDGEHIVAHAWVVCYGTVIGDTEHEQFASFESAAF